MTAAFSNTNNHIFWVHTDTGLVDLNIHQHHVGPQASSSHGLNRSPKLAHPVILGQQPVNKQQTPAGPPNRCGAERQL